MSKSVKELQEIAFTYRENIIRMAQAHKFGLHLGGSLSLTEILTVLYFAVARLDPANPRWSKRDRIVLSKGHGNVGLLNIMALRGFMPQAALQDFNKLGSYYSMHADAHVPGVEHSAGSLGHGLSVAIGMALAGKLDRAAWRVYCILGDGESMEGSIWEGLMSAAHFKLDNLTAVIDYNHLTQEGRTAETMNLEPLVEKCRAFGWKTFEVNGHNIPELLAAFQASQEGKPKMIIAHTLKGRGVPSYENQIKSHFASLTADQADEALALVGLERQQAQGK